MDDELKRLRKHVLVLTSIVLLLVLGIVAWGSIEISRLRSVVASIEIPQAINGIDGKDGYTPIKGVDYIDGNDGNDGRDSLSTTTIVKEPIYTNIPVPGPKGEKGDTGERGAPGRTVLIRINPLTLLDECRFLGDIDWQPLDECGVE